MKSYTVTRITGTPNWDTIPAMQMDVPYLYETDVRACAQLCWDDSGIYVRLQAQESDIRCEELAPLAPICWDSCLEFFLRPTEALSYFNIEYNPACALFLGYGTNVKNVIRLTLPDEKAAFQPRSYRTADGWGITYHIPFSFIRHFFPDFKAYAGLQFYGNFYKCGDKTAHPHYLSWNAIELDTLTFHAPEFYGHLILGG